MKIKDCPEWPCQEYAEHGRILDYDYIRRRDIRKVHTLHQVEAAYRNVEWSNMIVGVNGVPWRVLIHKGRKPLIPRGLREAQR
jgi:hypothetical protein